MTASAYISGAAMTAFGKLPGFSSLDLQARAAEEALQESGLARGDIDGLLVGYATTAPHLMPATRFAEAFGLRPSCAYGISVGGATGLAMVALARHLVAAGAARNVLVVAGENRRSGQSGASVTRTLSEVGDPLHEVPNGASVPAYYALAASEYMHRTGVSEEDLAELAVLMRRHAVATEGAQFRDPITVDDVMASRPIATPLKLLDCCSVSDGGASVVVSGAPSGSRTALRIAGTGESHRHQHMSSAPQDIAEGARIAAAAALRMSGHSIDQMGRAAIYDSFTITLMMLLEACGLSEPGGTAADARAGRFDRDGGTLPLNTHGGLLSYGHSGVSGGLAHLVEMVRRMREDEASASSRTPLSFLHADGGVFSSHVSLVLEGGA
ncbi:thiolase family protein [Roseibium aggregatum]|uniref:Thiolase family protein n=1 Tax=Roseibium aggregatum TaxID=187304 RepID=A0A939J5T2_9HYPH|nr:thiolase family protein [Roseibium aggregatum]MBN9673002.1 thiolase family protein [Roseibium aggregatum]